MPASTLSQVAPASEADTVGGFKAVGALAEPREPFVATRNVSGDRLPAHIARRGGQSSHVRIELKQHCAAAMSV